MRIVRNQLVVVVIEVLRRIQLIVQDVGVTIVTATRRGKSSRTLFDLHLEIILMLTLFTLLEIMLIMVGILRAGIWILDKEVFISGMIEVKDIGLGFLTLILLLYL